LTQGRIVTGVDIGTNKVVAVIGEIGEDSLKVIGVGKVKANAVSNEGFITNIDELRSKVELAVEEAEKMADVQVSQVFVNLSGNKAKCFTAHGEADVLNPKSGINNNDLMRALEDSKHSIEVAEDEKIIHMLARSFSVDGMDGIKDPVGMSGERLETDVYVVVSAENVIRNIDNCVQKAGLEVKDFVYEPLASSEAVLNQDEKEMGVVVVDIGGYYTTVTIYTEGVIRYSNIIPVGSNSITNDLAIVLRTSYDEAEKIKRRYANLYELDNETEKVELFNTSKENVKLVSKKYINEIIFARLEELLKDVYERIKDERLLNDIKSGVVVTGGGALIEGLPVYIEHLFDMSCRIGRPLSLKGLFDKINSPLYSTAAGILKYAEKSMKNSVYTDKGFFGNLLFKIREFFETYF